MAEAVTNKTAEQLQDKINEEFLNQDDIPIDEASGLQLYEHTLELSFMQKLQLRIAKERQVDVDTLTGDEFQVLKDHKKLEERKELLNNVEGFVNVARE